MNSITAPVYSRLEPLHVKSENKPNEEGPNDFIRLSQNPTVGELEAILRNRPSNQLRRALKTYLGDYNLNVGTTILSIAIQKKALPLIQKVLELQPKLAKQGSGGCKGVTLVDNSVPYILQAAESDDPVFALNAVKMLLESGASVNAADLVGCSPLAASAIRNSHSRLTHFLMSNGGVVYTKYLYYAAENDGRTDQRRFESIKAKREKIISTIELIVHVERFLNEGTLCCKSIHSMNVIWPEPVRRNIVGYILS